MTPEEIQRLQELEEREEMEMLRTQLGAKGGAKTDPQPYNPKPIFSNAVGWIDRKEPKLEEAAKAGVDVTSGAPQGTRTGRAAFALSEAQANDYLKKEVQRVLGQQADIRRGPQSGEVEYFDPTDSRWKLLRNNGIGQEIIKQSGDLMTTVGSLAGMLGGPASTPAREIMSGAAKTVAGSAVADYARTSIGNALGVNEEITFEDQAKSAAKAGAIEGALDVAGGTAYNIARYAKRSVMGKEIFTPEEAEQLLQGMGKYKGLVDEINAKSDTEFTPFIHQLNDPDSAAAQIAESMYRRMSASSDPDIRLKVAQARSNQWGALRSYFAAANEPFNAGLPATAEGRAQAGQGVAQGIQNEISGRMQQVEQKVAAEEAAAMQAVAGLPNSQKLAQMDASSATRAQLFAQSQQSQAKVREAYKQFDEHIGYDDAMGRSPNYIEVTDPELKTYIDKFGRNTITGKMKGGKPRIEIDKNGKPTGKVFVDVSTFTEAGKRLDELYRGKTEAGHDVEYSDRDLLSAHSKVLDTLSTYLQKGSLDGTLPEGTYASWVAARAEAKRDANTFKEGFLADFLAKDKTGRWVIKDQQALSQMLAGKDLQALSEMKSMIQHDPVAMAEVKKALFAWYESKATKNGLPSAALHREFMKPDNAGEVLDIFFKNEDFKKLDSYKDMAESLMASQESAKTAERLIREDLVGKKIGITRWNPEDITRAFLREKMDSATAAKLTKLANKYGTRKELQNGVMNEIQMKVFPDGPAGQMDFNALQGVLDKSGANLVPLLGPDYVNNLRKMAQMKQVIHRAPSEINDPPTMTRLQMGLKAVIRPMSREGNFMNFLRQNRREEIPSMVWEALTNPDELKRMANIVRIAVANTRVAGTATAVAGAEVREEDYVK